MEDQKALEEAEKIWNEMASQDGSPEPTAQEPSAEESPQEPARPEPGQEEPQKPKEPDNDIEFLKRELHKIKSDQGRLRAENERLKAEQQRYLALIAQWEKKEPQPASEPEPEPWKRVEQDYSDIAEGIKAYLESKLQRVIPPDVVTKNDLEQDRARERYERELASIAEVNPNWVSEVKTPEFADWLGRQPIEIQRLAYDNEPIFAKRLIELWTNHKHASSNPNAQNQQRLKAAAQPARTKSQPVAEDSLEGEAYWNYLAARYKNGW